MNVSLNQNEVLVSTYIGSRRNAEASFRKRSPRFPEKTPGELWGFHIEAAHAECAVAKLLGLYWGFGVNTFHTPDITGTNYEVRWSQRPNLKVRPDDSGIVISVSGKSPDYVVHGWINAEDAKRDEWKCASPPPCYFVPHDKLRPIEELRMKRAA
jgi:hypothetical protein